ncbi:hypothetical protein N7468_005015 [Penicillium chermesinum]|uniref:Phosphorylase n=1 Tax=Penicillium chermesinum TaxID=63820 RepID=A0A9W9TPA2_9EURO|nr:uncharacterized protein N7468_005015 [Penicillium chermesinum]KAJ5232059.1 hypothetical protein N7468_005015 [Penicillium chermesinum]
MPLDLNYDEISSKFDRLVADGIVFYKPSTLIPLTHRGMTVRPPQSPPTPPHFLILPPPPFQFSFHIIEGHKTKPQEGDPVAATKAAQAAASNPAPCFGPGSDIANDHPDICITTVNGTHLLTMNKFPVFRPMLLLLTVDSYRRQHEPLARADLDAGWSVIDALRAEHYVFYNCTFRAGASRQHKHLQIVPAPGASEEYAAGYRFFPDYEGVGPGAEWRAPFTYFLVRWEGARLDADFLLEKYLGLLQKARVALGVAVEEQEIPHNFVLTKRWMMVIPRRAKVSHGLTANSAGMLGSMYIISQEQLDAWKEAGPTNVLAGLGIADEEF